MKTPMKPIVTVYSWICTIALVSNLITTVAKSETYSDTGPLTADAKQQILAWNLKTLVQAYEEVGHTNVAWDKAAKAALTALAYSQAHIDDLNGRGYKDNRVSDES